MLEVECSVFHGSFIGKIGSPLLLHTCLRQFYVIAIPLFLYKKHFIQSCPVY